jgi:mRNA-degrading endonuclease RelE of RelBE toxin-antitoxin system
VGKAVQYWAVFSEEAAGFLLALPKRKQRRVADLVRQLARNPFVGCDYVERDENGREILHLLVEDYVFAYWLDHPVSEIRILEIEDAS